MAVFQMRCLFDAPNPQRCVDSAKRYSGGLLTKLSQITDESDIILNLISLCIPFYEVITKSSSQLQTIFFQRSFDVFIYYV